MEESDYNRNDLVAVLFPLLILEIILMIAIVTLSVVVK